MATRSILKVLTLFFFLTSTASACIWSVNNGEFSSEKNVRFDLNACWMVMRLIFLLVGAHAKRKLVTDINFFPSMHRLLTYFNSISSFNSFFEGQLKYKNKNVDKTFNFVNVAIVRVFFLLHISMYIFSIHN